MVLVASLSIQEAFPMIYSNGYLLELEVKNLVQISILTLTLQRLEITVNKGQSLFLWGHAWLHQGNSWVSSS